MRKNLLTGTFTHVAAFFTSSGMTVN